MIIVGSQALRIGLEKIKIDLPYKRPGRPDLDIFCNAYESAEFISKAGLKVISSSDGKTGSQKILAKAPDDMMVEFDIAAIGSSTHHYLLYAQTMAILDQAEFYGIKIDVAPLEMLYSIKRGHRHSPRKFHKHVKDYNFLREILDGKDIFERVTKLRYQETKARDGLKTPSLDKTAKDFFDDSVSNKTFIHDEIHAVMAFYDKPLFERIKIDPDKVTCSKDKFMKILTDTQKRECVQEEAYVIALERAIIPMLFENGPLAKPRDAYEWAVMRICTNLTSGWFREWALENYDNIMFWYNEKYVEKFLTAVEESRINRIERKDETATILE